MPDKSSADMIESTGPAATKAATLDKVFSLATQFSTCVEAFSRIHPSKDHSHAQKIALTKLGLQQTRLLIFGDAVGISAPPATIAKHMIPSHPAATNPDPHLPVNFAVRDARLDEEAVHEKVRFTLNEIAGRPAHLSRDELMDKYGLKSPKRFSMTEYPALDTNRMAAFREKYALLQDLVRQSGARANIKRNTSMASNNWTVKDTSKFDEYVKTVRIEVDGLIDYFGVSEQVDRGTRSDIRSMAWHPELTGRIVQQDWEKLRLIREACEVDYPQYIEVADSALAYIKEELQETSLANKRAALGVAPGGLNGASNGTNSSRRRSEFDIRAQPPKVVVPEEKTPLQLAAEGALRSPNISRSPSRSRFESRRESSRIASPVASPTEEKTPLQLAAEGALVRPNLSRSSSRNRSEKRPGWLSAFRWKSWSKSRSEKSRSNSTAGLDNQDPPRSMSEVKGFPLTEEEDEYNDLEPVRSKSVGAIPDEAAPLDLDTRVKELDINEETETGRSSFDRNALAQIPTANSNSNQRPLAGVSTNDSLIDRHDMYKGMGRIETKDIRDRAHDPAV